MPTTRSAEKTSAQSDPLEKAEATKEAGQQAAPDGIVGEKQLDAAIVGNDGPDPEKTSEDDDPLEKAEATIEK